MSFLMISYSLPPSFPSLSLSFFFAAPEHVEIPRPGIQGFNLHHSSDPSHRGNYARSSTTRPPGNSQWFFFLYLKPKVLNLAYKALYDLTPAHFWLLIFWLSLLALFVSVFPFFFLFFCFLGPHPWHMEVSRLWVESELQLPAYTTATATPGLSCDCGGHHSSWQCQILKPLSEARDGTRVLTDANWVSYHWAMTGTPGSLFQEEMNFPGGSSLLTEMR